MAQLDTRPNLDLSNATVIHCPVGPCSDLDTQRGREDEVGGEGEDEEVELAEEVGEDVLVMGEVGEGQTEGEGERVEREAVRIIQVALLPNGVLGEEEGGEGGGENRERGMEVGEEEHEKTDEKTERECKGEEAEESKETQKNNLGESSLPEDEKGGQPSLERDRQNEEDKGKEQNKKERVIPSAEKEVTEESRNGEGDMGSNEHQVLSTSDDAEHGQDEAGRTKSTKSSVDNIDKPEAVIPSTNDEVTGCAEYAAADTISVLTPVTMGTNEKLKIQDDLCQTACIIDNDIPIHTSAALEAMANQNSRSTNENEAGVKAIVKEDSSQANNREGESINNDITRQGKDGGEGNVEDEAAEEPVKDPVSISDDVLDAGEMSQKVEQPDLTSEPIIFKEGVDERSEEPETQAPEGELTCAVEVRTGSCAEQPPVTEGCRQGTGKGGMRQREQEEEEEQLRLVGDNALTKRTGEEEEDEKIGNNIVIDDEEHGGRAGVEMEEQKILELETFLKDLIDNQATVGLPQSIHCQDVDLDQVEEAAEPEERGEIELDQPGAEVTSEEPKSMTEVAAEFQEQPSQITKGADGGGKLSEQPLQNAVREEEKGEGGAEEEGGVEMVEEPVTVLDDEIEATEEGRSNDLEEPKPASTTAASEDMAKANDGENQELDGGKDEEQKDEKREVETEQNDRGKGLSQAMENGMCPERRPFSPSRKEGWGTARVTSLKRKDNDWIKKDQAEGESTLEKKDWRKELRPVKKDLQEIEGGRKEWVKKEVSAEQKSPARKEDWIKELKSVIKDESLPKKRDEQVKKKRVVLMEDGQSYIPQREERREEVKLLSHKSPLPPLRNNSTAPQDQAYEISLYVKVMTSTLLP